MPQSSRLTAFRRRLASSVVGGIGLAGLALILYGSMLFAGQAHLWLRWGTWVPLPAVALFTATPSADDRSGPPRFVVDSDGSLWYLGKLDTSSPDPQDALMAQHRLTVRYPPFVVFRRYVPYVATPHFERWLQRPTSWFGFHKAVIGLLDFLSVPAAAVMIGIVIGVWAIELETLVISAAATMNNPRRKSDRNH